MIYDTLKKTGLPCAYSHFQHPVEPPYICYIGNGQLRVPADNTLRWRKNTYQVEYYFTQKNEANETAIEDTLLGDGFVFSKSDDVYIEDENLFVIYYTV